MGKKIALGSSVSNEAAVVSQPTSLEEQVLLLQQQIADLTEAFLLSANERRDDNYTSLQFDNANKDGLPIGISLVGHSMRGGTHVLTINEDRYYVGTSGYHSLSAAAEAVSGVRRSGWTFWKLPDGRTAKEAFGKG